MFRIVFRPHMENQTRALSWDHVREEAAENLDPGGVLAATALQADTTGATNLRGSQFPRP